jgi:hypothetical protein
MAFDKKKIKDRRKYLRFYFIDESGLVNCKYSKKKKMKEINCK